MVTIRLDFAVRLGSAVRLRSTVLVPIALALVFVLPAFADSLFAPPTTLKLPSNAAEPAAIRLADFNGDGNLDIIVLCVSETADGSRGGFNIFLGNGDGTFQSPATYLSQRHARTLAVGDFNEDGKLDVFVVNDCLSSGFCNQAVGDVFFGAGAGTFSAPVSIGFPWAGPLATATADFNGDGHTDLAITFSGPGITLNPVAGVVFLGDGHGNFNTGGSFVTNYRPKEPVGLAVADFDQDGKQDIAVLATGFGYVNLMLGNGDGTFHLKSTRQVGHETAIAATDFTGDGVPDLVITTQNVVRVLDGHGDGTFAIPQGLRVAPNASLTRVTTGDFNGDGRNDFALVDSANSNLVVYLNQPDGRFREYTFDDGMAGSPGDLAAGDLNNDGALDILTANNGPTELAPGSISIFLNQTKAVGSTEQSVVEGKTEKP